MVGTVMTPSAHYRMFGHYNAWAIAGFTRRQASSAPLFLIFQRLSAKPDA
jgi:hypothetical protein